MISIVAVSKNFSADDRSVAALRSVHLEVNRGEFFVLLGPSGSGKTTLLRAVAGLEKPDQGEISLDGKVVYSRSQVSVLRQRSDRSAWYFNPMRSGRI
ncbi:MAG: ATP-binding cassette domain-containing protein [Candidatus Binatia bacterium]